MAKWTFFKAQDYQIVPIPSGLVKLWENHLSEIKRITNLNEWALLNHTRDKLTQYYKEWKITREQYEYLSNKDNIIRAWRGEDKRMKLFRRFEYEMIPLQEKDLWNDPWKEYFLKIGIDFIFDWKFTLWIPVQLLGNGNIVVRTMYIKVWSPETMKNNNMKYNNPASFSSNDWRLIV